MILGLSAMILGLSASHSLNWLENERERVDNSQRMNGFSRVEETGYGSFALTRMIYIDEWIVPQFRQGC